MTAAKPEDALYPALVRALGALSDIPSDREGQIGNRSYRYANLGDVLSHVRPVFAGEGLAVVQHVTHAQGAVTVHTIVLHTSGESYAFPPLTLPASGTVQQIGSAITYARRYSLMASLGLATDDDDGASASPPPAPPPTRPPDVHDVARGQGWPDAHQQRVEFDRLVEQTNTLGYAGVKAWVKGQNIAIPSRFSRVQAAAWEAALADPESVASAESEPPDPSGEGSSAEDRTAGEDSRQASPAVPTDDNGEPL